MRRKGFEGESGPATLGTTARAHLLLRVWCKDAGTGPISTPASRPSGGADLDFGADGESARGAAAGTSISSSATTRRVQTPAGRCSWFRAAAGIAHEPHARL